MYKSTFHPINGSLFGVCFKHISTYINGPTFGLCSMSDFQSQPIGSSASTSDPRSRPQANTYLRNIFSAAPLPAYAAIKCWNPPAKDATIDSTMKCLRSISRIRTDGPPPRSWTREHSRGKGIPGIRRLPCCRCIVPLMPFCTQCAVVRRLSDSLPVWPSQLLLFPSESRRLLAVLRSFTTCFRDL